MKSSEIRKSFLKFFEGNQHTIVPSASLIPSDPTVLLTLAGMLPFKPYFLGKEKAPYNRATSCQKCIRTIDLDQVGKTPRHLSFFEMLGNFSFGSYFKTEAIAFAWELLTKEWKIPKDKLWISVYKDDPEAFEIWNKTMSIPADNIVKLGEKDNFWSAGETGPCGPCSEIHYDRGESYSKGDKSDNPGKDTGRFMEIWNLVFMEFNRDEKGKLNPLPNKNIDTGMGLERISAVLQGKETIFETDLLWPMIQNLEKISDTKYSNSPTHFRIVADHIRSATHLITDGVFPTNEGRGYVLRRLIRKAIVSLHKLGITKPILSQLSSEVISEGDSIYHDLETQKQATITLLETEEKNFRNTLDQGLELLEKMIGEKNIDSFLLYDSFGFPFDLTQQYCAEKGIAINEKEFLAKMEQRKVESRKNWTEKSRMGVGGETYLESEDPILKQNMANHHSATHLLHKALQIVLGSHARQAGSLVEPNRLRFDFNHFQKMTPEGIKKVEDLVNEQISLKLPVVIKQMPLAEAKKTGAVSLFGEKYGETVCVVSIGDFSKELCGGTHVKNTGEISYFKILSESSVAAGVRRIEALAGQPLIKYLQEQIRFLEAENSVLEKQAEELKINTEALPETNLKADTCTLCGFFEQLKKWKTDTEAVIAKHKKDKAKEQGSEILDLVPALVKMAMGKRPEARGIKYLIENIEKANIAQLKLLADAVFNQVGKGLIYLQSAAEGKLNFVCKISDDLKDIAAGDIIKKAAEISGGKGGGKANFAQGGGGNPDKANEVLSAVSSFLENSKINGQTTTQPDSHS